MSNGSNSSLTPRSNSSSSMRDCYCVALKQSSLDCNSFEYPCNHAIKTIYFLFKKYDMPIQMVVRNYFIDQGVVNVDKLLSISQKWIEVLSSIVSYKPNTIDLLLNQEFNEEKEITYIDINEVVKKKGTSIHGPRRQDVDRFNRKLFESQSRDVLNTYHERLFVNLRFYPEINIITNEVISCDYVDITCYTGLIKSRHILILHKKQNEVVLSLSTDKKYLYFEICRSEFISSGNLKKTINILHVGKFEILSIEFINENAAEFVYKNYFLKE